MSKIFISWAIVDLIFCIYNIITGADPFTVIVYCIAIIMLLMLAKDSAGGHR